MFDGFGHGANRQTLAGVPHFRDVEFYGRFPTADLVFHDERFPGERADDGALALHPAQRPRQLDAGRDVRVRDRQRHRRAIDLHARRHARATTAPTAASTPSRRHGGISSLHLTSSDTDLPPTRARRPHHRHRRRRCRAHRPPLSRPVVRRPRRVLEGVRPARPAARAALRPAARHAAHEPAARARHARRARHRAGRRAQDGPLRHLLELPARRHLLGLPHQARRRRSPTSATPTWTQLLRDAMGGLARQRHARRSRAGTSSQAQTIAFRDGLFGSTLPAEIKDAASRDARAAPHRHRDPPRGRRALGLGGPAHQRRLLRGLLHPCLELPAGAVASVPGARADAARDRVHLQPAADRRPHLPPEAAARLRLRHHRPLRRRAFRRHHQDLSRLEAVGRHRLAAAATGRSIKRAIEYAWSPENPGPLGPRRRPASSPAASTRRSTWSCSGPTPGSARCMSRRCSPRAEMAAALGDDATSPTNAGALGKAGADYIDTRALQRPLLHPEDRPLATSRCSTPFDTGRNAGVLADGFMETYWSDEYRRAQVPDRRRLHHRPDPRPVARRGRRASAASSTRTRSRRRCSPSTPTTSAPTSPTTSTPAATTPTRTKAAC